MLVIRHEQMRALRKEMLEGFEDRMVDYLAKRFPEVCPPKNELAVRESIQKGIERSKSYGITTEYDVARYIELMFVFSEDFDSSQETFWAPQILENPEVGPSEKMDQLYAQADLETHH